MVGAQTKAEEWLPAVSAEGTPEAVTVSPNGAAAASAHTLAADEKEEHARSLADDARTAAHLAEDMALRAARVRRRRRCTQCGPRGACAS